MLITLYMDIRISTRTDDEYSTAAEAVHSLKEAMDLGAARSCSGYFITAYCDSLSPSAGGMGIFSPRISVTNLYITML